MVKSPSAFEAQRTPAEAGSPALRVNTSTSSATMNAE